MSADRTQAAEARRRAVTKQLMLDHLQRGPCSRAHLGRVLKLSQVLSYTYMTALIAEGLVEEAGPAPAGKSGPRPLLYRLKEAPPPAPVREVGGIRTQIRGPWPGLNYTGGKS